MIAEQLISKRQAINQLDRLSNVINSKDDINKLIELFNKMRELQVFSSECKQEQFNHFIDITLKVGSPLNLDYIVNIITSVYPNNLEVFREFFYTKNGPVFHLIRDYEAILKHPDCFTRYWELVSTSLCDEKNLELRRLQAIFLTALIDYGLFNLENEQKVLGSSSEALSLNVFGFAFGCRALKLYRSQRYFDYLVNPHYPIVDKYNLFEVVQFFSRFLHVPERAEFYLNYILDHAFDENTLILRRAQATLLESLTASELFNPQNERKVLDASVNVLSLGMFQHLYIKLYRSQSYFDFLLNQQHDGINKETLSIVMGYFSRCFNTPERTDFYLHYIVNHADVLLDDQVLRAFSITPDHFRTPEFINEIVTLCSQNTTKELRIQSICAYINQRLFNGHDDNPIQQINYAQSVHASSVEKSAFESAKRLHELYHGRFVFAHNLHVVKQAILDYINTDDANSAHSLRNSAAKRYLDSIETTGSYNSFSKLNAEQLLLCCWEGIHDNARRLVSLDDAKQALIVGLYEIQRGYNLNEDNVDDGAEDRPICVKGSFVKLVSSLNKIHTAVDIIFITSKQASMKFPAVVKSCLDVYLKEQQNLLSRQNFLALLQSLQEDGVKYVEDEIKGQVASLMMDEFGSLYNSNDQNVDFVNLLNAYEFVDVSSTIDFYQKRSIESISTACAAASASEGTERPIRSLGFFPAQPNKNNDISHLVISNNEVVISNNEAGDEDEDEDESIQPPSKRFRK